MHSTKNLSVKDITAVICVKNEEARIEDCLKTVILNQPGEIIVVDGDSSDNTVSLSSNFTQNVIVTKNSNLTRDRQIGIDAANNPLIAMIDADHRLGSSSLENMLSDLKLYNFDIVQSQLISYTNNNYWNAAEEESWELTHNKPGPKKMIGVAPAIFVKSIFFKINFDDEITKTIDDTDFIYRLSKIKGIKFGIGNSKIKQLHFGSLSNYLRKFKWYGIGDSEFCRKHPQRAFSMFFHLLIRYPIIYPIKSLIKRRYRAIPFFILQGYVRFYGLIIGSLVKKQAA